MWASLNVVENPDFFKRHSAQQERNKGPSLCFDIFIKGPSITQMREVPGFQEDIKEGWQVTCKNFSICKSHIYTLHYLGWRKWNILISATLGEAEKYVWFRRKWENHQGVWQIKREQNVYHYFFSSLKGIFPAEALHWRINLMLWVVNDHFSHTYPFLSATGHWNDLFLATFETSFALKHDFPSYN